MAAAQAWPRLQANTDAPVTLSGPDLPAPGTVMSDGHYSELLKQIREHMRPVCSEMPQEEFDALTARLAQIEWKYTRQAAGPASGPFE